MHRYIACGAYGKNFKKFRARCHVQCLETRDVLALGKGGLCRVPETGHSAKKINKKLKKIKKFFAECLTATTRQSLTVGGRRHLG